MLPRPEHDWSDLRPLLEERKERFLFATVSGAHLYGFESPDSDIDLRGVFVLPVEEVVGLKTGSETLTLTFDRAGREMDLVAHDVLKFCQLLTRRNGYVLEQLFSPLVVWGQAALEELRSLARDCVVRHVYYHYRGFLNNQIKFVGRSEASVKDVLYGYRVALTGLHLLASGEVESYLPLLLELYPQNGVHELIARKRQGSEKGALPLELRSSHLEALIGLEKRLHDCFESGSVLPDEARGQQALHDFVVRTRLGRP